MKCTIPEISWHNRDPVLSVDIQLKSSDNCKYLRLASGGSDSHVLIWYLVPTENGSVQLELASDLARHQRVVNTVRWSPSGEHLASGDDESIIFIWRLKNESEQNTIFDDKNDQDRETWQIFKTLRGHLDDVYDISWSLDSNFLLSGSVDNTAIVWDVKKGKHKAILNDHKGFVQGVAWDPKDQYLATISTDRYFRIFNAKTYKVSRRVKKALYPVDNESPLHNKVISLFHDDTLPTFFRRLTFSPDGELIIVPSGLSEILSTTSNDKATAKASNGEKPVNTTYIFTRYNTKQPAIVIPSPDQFTVAVRCCPAFFELRPYAEDNRPIIDLPYRIVFAIASKSSVYLYDTQQKMPFAIISNIHYARLTDITWSADGRILIVSSVDGFCTLITFEADELGKVYTKSADESAMANVNDDEEKENPRKKNINDNTLADANPIEIRKKPRMASTSPKDAKDKVIVEVNNVKLEIPETIIATTESFESPEYKEKPVTPIAVRRAPRANPSTPVSEVKTVASLSEATKSSTKAKPIAVRRQPRNILPSKVSAIDKTGEDEALDAWPIPFDAQTNKNQQNDIVIVSTDPSSTCEIIEKTEDMRLVYDGDSESDEQSDTKAVEKEIEKSVVNETKTPDTNQAKTPRRVQLRTISTPKSKKKLL